LPPTSMRHRACQPLALRDPHSTRLGEDKCNSRKRKCHHLNFRCNTYLNIGGMLEVSESTSKRYPPLCRYCTTSASAFRGILTLEDLTFLPVGVEPSNCGIFRTYGRLQQIKNSLQNTLLTTFLQENRRSRSFTKRARLSTDEKWRLFCVTPQ